MKTPEEFISQIPVNAANFDYIAKTGRINGNLHVDIKKAMEKYCHQTTGEILAALREIIHLHSCEQEGLSSGRPTAADWLKAYEKGVEVLNNTLNIKP